MAPLLCNTSGAGHSLNITREICFVQCYHCSYSLHTSPDNKRMLTKQKPQNAETTTKCRKCGIFNNCLIKEQCFLFKLPFNQQVARLIMARNAEKAMTTLARWRAAQVKEHGGKEERRPYLATECTDLKAAEKWRVQIIREISKKVAQIQNAGLGEFRLRDLNDEINKLLREKKHWEYQIRELGGPDFLRMGPRMLDHEGREVPGNRGYKYFGAAKDLPGVRELFEHEPPPPPRRTRAELMKNIDADYYGYMDEEDGLLIAMERKKEEKMLRELGKKPSVSDELELAFEEVDSDDEDISTMFSSSRYIHPPPVPSDQDIQNLIIDYKKRELLETFAGVEGIQKNEEIEDLANLSSSDDEAYTK